jgi:hypothetical protein
LKLLNEIREVDSMKNGKSKVTAENVKKGYAALCLPDAISAIQLLAL